MMAWLRRNARSNRSDPESNVKAQQQSAQPEAGDIAVPVHVAIIMDGNGRWATGRGLPRVAGHRAGRAGGAADDRGGYADGGVRWLTLYAFSSENWARPRAEVLDLTGLLRHYLRQELAELKSQGVRLRVIGERERFDADICADLDHAERETAGNTALNLNVALSYGARAEIVAAARRVAEAALQGTLDPPRWTRVGSRLLLATAGMPDPDLVIRTSGERRLSNFLLWQSAYAESSSSTCCGRISA